MTPVPSDIPTSTATELPNTQTPSQTPSVFPTDTPVAPPSPTPGCTGLGVALEMPSHSFYPGDDCGLDAYLCNPAEDIPDLRLFVLLDVFGEYWFAPEWTHYPEQDISFYTIPQLSSGVTAMTIIPEFLWPSGAGSASGLNFHGALTNASVTQIVGDWSSWSFSFAER
jgi:hypothetical protein